MIESWRNQRSVKNWGRGGGDAFGFRFLRFFVFPFEKYGSRIFEIYQRNFVIIG